LISKEKEDLNNANNTMNGSLATDGGDHFETE